MIKKFTVFFLISGLFALNNNLFGISESNKSHFNPTINKKEQEYDLIYNIEPFYEIKKVRFAVTLEFRGDKSGETKILLPGNFGGKNNYEGIKFLKPLSENTSIINTDNPEQKIIKHPSGEPVKLYYQVEEIRNDNVELGNHYLTILNKTYFHFLGETFFVFPAWDWYSNYKILITWNHMPYTWSLANSFGINEKIQSISVSLDQLSSSLFMGGDFRIIKRNVDNNPVYLSIRGRWNFSDDQLLDIIKDIISIERNFWNDHEFPYYIISVIPIEGRGEQGGISRTNAYALFLTPDRIIDYRLKRIIAHETFHIWLGEKIKFSEPEALSFWFKEGFSDYYARLLLLRANLITQDEYVEEYNKILYAYFTSSVRDEKNERVVKEFWTNQNIMKLPYMRGDIIAHNLNAIIYKNSRGSKNLDNLMLDLFKRSKTESLTVSNGSLSALIRFYAGEQALADIMKCLNSGASLKSHPEALGPCYELEIESFRKLWLIGELYEIPSYKLKSTNKSNNKKCLEWFGVK